MMRPTIRHVAREAGVSVTTASRALNQREDVSPATRERVLAAARRLDYVPSSIARGLVWGRSKTLGVVVNDNASPVYAGVLRGVEASANAAGYGLLLCNSADSQEQALRCLASLRANYIEGVLLTPIQTDRRDVEELQNAGIPFVLVLRHFSDLESVDFVVPDNIAGGYLVTQHLLSLGHRVVGHIAGPPYTSSGQGRLAGYRQALAECDLPFDADLVAYGGYSVAGGFEAAMRLLQARRRPSAIFAATDLQAVGVIKAAHALGLRIPDDLALAGGDGIELAEFLEVPLTTFHIPAREIGARAADILLARLNGTCTTPQHVIFKPTLVVRKSSGGSR
jgi:LacI family transcriptional regulator